MTCAFKPEPLHTFVRQAEVAIPESKAALAEALQRKEQLVSELASEVDVEILAEDTIEALGAKLALHSDSLESYVTQIHQLRFDTDELTKRHLKTQAAAARADVELQLAVDEFDRLQHKRIQMQRTSRCLTRAVAVSR